MAVHHDPTPLDAILMVDGIGTFPRQGAKLGGGNISSPDIIHIFIETTYEPFFGRTKHRESLSIRLASQFWSAR